MELSCLGKGSVSYGLGADFSLPHCLVPGLGRGGIFTHVQCLKFTRSHLSVNAYKGCEKSSVAVQIDARIQSSNFHLTLRFVDQSHARLFVEIYIRACDKQVRTFPFII